MSELIINKCYEVFFDRGPLQNPVIIKIKRIYKDIDLWSNKEVDYIEAEAIDDNGIYYESISYPKTDAELFKPIDDCDFMKIKQNLAFSKLLNERLGANTEYLNQDIIKSILKAPRSVSVKTLKQKAGRNKKKRSKKKHNKKKRSKKGGKRSKKKRSKKK
tara:strand:- start:324 stop:803 length:480 start_codon:yes stop_codon:yes gene_type:complete